MAVFRAAVRDELSSLSAGALIAAMNLHHLELFYYVARHGGISRAVRAMPYGIQQPAVSGQILALEQDLNARLFERQPFRLTPEGRELYDFVRPFFSEAAAVGDRIRERQAPKLRIAASELILRDYLPPVISAMQSRHPALRFGLRSGNQPQVEQWLEERQIDLAVVPVHQRPASGISWTRLISLPLVLLAPKNSRVKNARELWTRSPLLEPLVGLPAGESIMRIFAAGLKKKNIEWPVAIEAPSAELVVQYVANGYGYGVTVGLPQLTDRPHVRVLPLRGFASLEIAALWRPPVSPLHEAAREFVQSRVQELWPRG